MLPRERRGYYMEPEIIKHRPLSHRLRVRGWCGTLHGPGQLVIKSKEFCFLGFSHVSVYFCEKIALLDAWRDGANVTVNAAVDRNFFP